LMRAIKNFDIHPGIITSNWIMRCNQYRKNTGRR
jgi:hypothetical protein